VGIPVTAVWELRANAGNSGLQGGFFSSARSGTDYSQQDSPQLSLTDIATDGAGTGISSATGGFTAAMVGNGIYITGGSTTAGWYEIVAVTDTNAATIDRSAGASKTGATGRVGGAASFVSGVLAIMVAGNVGWVKADATHTLTGNLSTAAGSEAAAIDLRGYGTTRGDSPTGDNRPLVACGAYYVTPGNYVRVSHLRMTGTGTYVIAMGAGTVFLNVKAVNSSETASRRAFSDTNGTATLVSCEASSTAGNGVYNAVANGLHLLGCYIHDCGEYGVYCSSGGGYLTLVATVFDTCVVGVYGTTIRRGFVAHCVFYGNTSYGFQLTTGDYFFICNSIFSGNGVGISLADGHEGENYEDWNDFYDNTTDRENIDAGAHDLAIDPGFANAAAGDFSTSAAGLRNAAIPALMPGGAFTNYADIGLQVQATGGGGSRAYVGGL
jgi:hypothetical protein